MKLIDDRSTLSAMADEIVAGRAEHPTGALRLLGIPDGSAAERRLLRKWAGNGCFVAMRGAARRALIAERADVDAAMETNRGQAVNGNAWHGINNESLTPVRRARMEAWMVQNGGAG